MKAKLLIAFLIFVFQFGFSQTEKHLQAKILYETFPLQGVEVLNLASKKTTITDSNGQFSILAKNKDTLMFVSKNYEYKKFIVKKEDLDNNDLSISLIKKPEQLEEVTVIQKKALPHIGFNQEYADKSSIEKAAKSPKPIGVYDGTLVNSPDLMRIGGMLLGLFVKQKETNKNKTPELEFKKIATETCNQDYFNKSLKLKPEEVPLFLEFCDADPKSKTILANTNPLVLMDFLLAKSIEFKKLSP